MSYIYIIINPKFKNYSLIDIVDIPPINLSSELNTKYKNSQLRDDFYKLVYVKVVDDKISVLTSKLKSTLSKFEVPSSKFYKISVNTAIEILETLFPVNAISDDKLFTWWNELNLGWKYSFKQNISPGTSQTEVESKLNEISIVNLREILLIKRLNLYRDEIESLEPLKFLKQLEELYCNFETEKKGRLSLEPLIELYKLKKIWIGNHSSKTEIKLLEIANPKCRIYSND